MAKHKKKQFKPTSKPEDSVNTELPSTESSDTPPTENQIPPKKPEIPADEIDVNRRLKKLFWLRIALSVMAGTAATFIFEPYEGEERRWLSIGFMILIFIISIGIAKGMRLNLPSSKRKKIVLEGIGSFIFLYLFMWILTFTIVHVSDTTGSIPSPFT